MIIITALKNPVSWYRIFLWKIYITIQLNRLLACLKYAAIKKVFFRFRLQKSYREPTQVQPPILKKAVKQLNEYFKGNRKEFNLELNPSGTDFQQHVWKHVSTVLYGETASYLDIAIKTGSKNNTRAVGLANGKNPIPIIIPCHRILGANGKLTGYSGGIDKKRLLLQHELKYFKPSYLLF